jgi:AraC-like DNA-binding protein
MKLCGLANECHFFTNNEDMALGLSVNMVGFQSIQPNSSYPLVTHPEKYLFSVNSGRILDEYQLIYVTKGIGQLKIGSSNAMPICAGQVVFIYPNQWHFYSPSRDLGWDEYSVGFSSVFFENTLTRSISTIENQVIDLGLNAELVDLFRRAIEVSRSAKSTFKEHLQGIVLHIIGLIITEKQCKSETYEYSQQVVEIAKIIMSESIFMNLSPVELACKLNVNYVTFRKLFKESTGLAPAKYLMTLKMKKAKDYLLNSSFAVNVISSNLGFDSPDSFNKSFKKHTGQTASEYRRYCRLISR